MKVAYRERYRLLDWTNCQVFARPEVITSMFLPREWIIRVLFANAIWQAAMVMSVR